jgi:hypothetical protein
MAHPWVANGRDDLQICKITANILNKQCKQPTMGGPPTWGLGKGLTTSRHKKSASYKMLLMTSDLDGFFGITYEMENGYELWNAEC